MPDFIPNACHHYSKDGAHLLAFSDHGYGGVMQMFTCQYDTAIAGLEQPFAFDTFTKGIQAFESIYWNKWCKDHKVGSTLAWFDFCPDYEEDIVRVFNLKNGWFAVYGMVEDPQVLLLSFDELYTIMNDNGARIVGKGTA